MSNMESTVRTEAMTNILVIKTGSTLPSLAAGKGDFEDWILEGMGIDRSGADIIDVTAGAELPPPDGLTGVIITGSHAMVTDHAGWSERTAEWLPGAISRKIPTMGICYGHQLLAYALGGEVADNPKGREIGMVDVRLDGQAEQDFLLSGFMSPIKVHASHQQTVRKLPQDARSLASSDMDENQAFVIGGFCWGFQFHPEFEAEIAVAYLNHFRVALRFAGVDVDGLIHECADTPYGSRILKRFYQLISGNR